MTEIYGRQWETSYGHVGGEVFLRWLEALQEFTIEQIAGGLQMLQVDLNDFPPNLIKFMRLCRTSKHACHEPLLPEPEPVQTPETAQAALSEMRRIAGLPPKPLKGFKQPRPEQLEDDRR